MMDVGRDYIPMDRASQKSNGSSSSGGMFHSTSWSDHPPAYTNDYLTPSSPLPPPVPLSPCPSSFGHRPSHPLKRQHENTAQQFSRTDSGFVEDCPNIPVSPSKKANPRSSTIYEYIDPDRIRGTPRPQISQRNATSQRENNCSTAPSATTATIYLAACSPDSGDTSNQMNRRRLNPSYDALNRSTTQIYAETCHCKVQSSEQRQLRQLWFGFIILTIFMVFVLGVLSYLVFYVIPGLQSHNDFQGNRIKQLELDYRSLALQHNTSLQQYQHSELKLDAKMDASFEEGITDRIMELNHSVSSFGSLLKQINTDLLQKVHNISRMTEPQDVSGVANLDSCFYYKRATRQALPGPSSFTSWQPPLDSDLFRDNVVMSVNCGIEGGTLQFVEANIVSGRVQYRCHCDGQSPGARTRVCLVHFVLCPRLIPLTLTAV